MMPSARRSASCSRWVAEWLARIVPRRAWSTSSTAGWPGAISPSATFGHVHEHARNLRVSVIVAVRRLGLQRAGVAHLPAGLGIERCLVHDDGHRVAGLRGVGARAVASPARGPRPRRSRCRSRGTRSSRAFLGQVEPDRPRRRRSPEPDHAARALAFCSAMARRSPRCRPRRRARAAHPASGRAGSRRCHRA
jgi:hypothetical protein